MFHNYLLFAFSFFFYLFICCYGFVFGVFRQQQIVIKIVTRKLQIFRPLSAKLFCVYNCKTRVFHPQQQGDNEKVFGEALIAPCGWETKRWCMWNWTRQQKTTKLASIIGWNHPALNEQSVLALLSSPNIYEY